MGFDNKMCHGGHGAGATRRAVGIGMNLRALGIGYRTTVDFIQDSFDICTSKHTFRKQVYPSFIVFTSGSTLQLLYRNFKEIIIIFCLKIQHNMYI